MKFIFRQVKYANMDYGYCLILDNIDSLLRYELQLKGHYEEGFDDAVQSATRNIHTCIEIGWLTIKTGQSRGKSVLESFCEVVSHIFQAKMKAIQQFGKVYIHNNLQSFFVPLPAVVEYGDKVYRDSVFDIPRDKLPEPRFIRWGGGKHYYIKCGFEDVVVAGEQKWGTLKEAKEAFNIWRLQKRN